MAGDVEEMYILDNINYSYNINIIMSIVSV